MCLNSIRLYLLPLVKALENEGPIESEYRYLLCEGNFVYTENIDSERASS